MPQNNEHFWSTWTYLPWWKMVVAKKMLYYCKDRKKNYYSKWQNGQNLIPGKTSKTWDKTVVQQGRTTSLNMERFCSKTWKIDVDRCSASSQTQLGCFEGRMSRKCHSGCAKLLETLLKRFFHRDSGGWIHMHSMVLKPFSTFWKPGIIFPLIHNYELLFVGLSHRNDSFNLNFKWLELWELFCKEL